MAPEATGKRPRRPVSRRPIPGVLSDDDIRCEAEEGRLIVGGYLPQNVYQTCYELRVGSIYYDLSDAGRRVEVSPGDHILLKPFQQIVVITQEELSIPDDIVGRVLLKGRMFSVGIAPVHTYADPGFSGKLGIVLFNVSQNYLKLDPGSAIAKLEFERLPRAVSKPYAGQHGYQTEIWPIADQHILSESEKRRDRRIKSTGDELSRAFGSDFGRILDRIYSFERRLLLSALLYILFTVVLITYATLNDHAINTLVAFSIGLVTNLASTMLIFLATNVGRAGRAGR
jgi:dCTP deaminase